MLLHIWYDPGPHSARMVIVTAENIEQAREILRTTSHDNPNEIDVGTLNRILYEEEPFVAYLPDKPAFVASF